VCTLEAPRMPEIPGFVKSGFTPERPFSNPLHASACLMVKRFYV
jgi:hypothetical protein